MSLDEGTSIWLKRELKHMQICVLLTPYTILKKLWPKSQISRGIVRFGSDLLHSVSEWKGNAIGADGIRANGGRECRFCCPGRKTPSTGAGVAPSERTRNGIPRRTLFSLVRSSTGTLGTARRRKQGDRHARSAPKRRRGNPALKLTLAYSNFSVS